MHFSFPLTLLLLACGSATVEINSSLVAPVPAPVAIARKLVWSDEFDKDGLPNPTKWGNDVGGNGWGNNELQYYTRKRPANDPKTPASRRVI